MAVFASSYFLSRKTSHAQLAARLSSYAYYFLSLFNHNSEKKGQNTQQRRNSAVSPIFPDKKGQKMSAIIQDFPKLTSPKS